MITERPVRMAAIRTRFELVGNLHRPGGFDKPLGKRVIDAVLHEDAVGAHTGLAGIPIFRGDRTFDRHLDVGVVKDDERRVAAQFERQLLDRARTACALLPARAFFVLRNKGRTAESY